VYETIIHELRVELERLNNKYNETCRRCEEALKQAARVPTLEDEVRIYKELAGNSSKESQT
jgi:hypothetical protein